MVRQNDVQRTFRLPAGLDKKLAAEAKRLDRSVSWVIVKSLETTLKRKAPK
jgi:predicted transcriptional regulator